MFEVTAAIWNKVTAVWIIQCPSVTIKIVHSRLDILHGGPPIQVRRAWTWILPFPHAAWYPETLSSSVLQSLIIHMSPLAMSPLFICQSSPYMEQFSHKECEQDLHLPRAALRISSQTMASYRCLSVSAELCVAFRILWIVAIFGYDTGSLPNPHECFEAYVD
jgi:hypothetical protein